MKVYAITAGCYSDYHIVTICLDRKKAEEIIKVHNFDDDVTIEEYDTDEITLIKPGDNTWTVVFSCKTHDVEYVYGGHYIDVIRDIFQANCKKDNKIWYVDVYARSKEEVIKKASDKLNQYLAEQMGL